MGVRGLKSLGPAASRAEVRALLGHLDGTPRLAAGLLYGSGLRLGECLGLRVRDLQFSYGRIIVRGGNGDRDRVTVLPAAIEPALRRHLRVGERMFRTGSPLESL